jgi:hypothetical protein
MKTDQETWLFRLSNIDVCIVNSLTFAIMIPLNKDKMRSILCISAEGLSSKYREGRGGGGEVKKKRYLNI